MSVLPMDMSLYPQQPLLVYRSILKWGVFDVVRVRIISVYGKLFTFWIQVMAHIWLIRHGTMSCSTYFALPCWIVLQLSYFFSEKFFCLHTINKKEKSYCSQGHLEIYHQNAKNKTTLFAGALFLVATNVNEKNWISFNHEIKCLLNFTSQWLSRWFWTLLTEYAGLIDKSQTVYRTCSIIILGYFFFRIIPVFFEWQ